MHPEKDKRSGLSFNTFKLKSEFYNYYLNIYYLSSFKLPFFLSPTLCKILLKEGAFNIMSHLILMTSLWLKFREVRYFPYSTELQTKTQRSEIASPTTKSD